MSGFRGARHPLWERYVHPWEKSEWACMTTLDEQSRRVVLCWHCGQPWPCHEALIQQIEKPKRDHGAPPDPDGVPRACLACTHMDGRAYCGGRGDGPCAFPDREPGSWVEDRPVEPPALALPPPSE